MTDPITITEIPAITPLPVIDRTQPPSVVRPQVDTYFGTQLPAFTGQLNAVSEAIVQLGQDVLALRQATAADKSAAEGFKTQAGLYASAADTARGVAEAARQGASMDRAATETARDAAQVFADAAGAAVGLPEPLASRPLAALRVNAAGTGVEATYEAPAGDVKHIEITASAALAATQKGALIDVSGTGITLTLDAAELGNGWWCYLRNIGSAAVTASAAAGQTIDGVASGVIKPGMTLLVQCDGEDFHCVRVGPKCVIEVLTSGTSWAAPLGVRVVKVSLQHGGNGGTGGDTRYTSNQPSGLAGPMQEGYVNVEPSEVVPYAIGAGGVGGSAPTSVIGGSGRVGGTTWFKSASLTFPVTKAAPTYGTLSGIRHPSILGGTNYGYGGIGGTGNGGNTGTAGQPGGAGLIILEY